MISKMSALNCAVGVAAALTLGSATGASAQQTTPSRDSTGTVTGASTTSASTGSARSTRRIRVGKDRDMSESGTTSGTSSGMRTSPAGATTDTASATVSAPATAPTTTPTTTTSAPVDTTTTVVATVPAVPAATASSTSSTMSGRFGNGFYIGLGGGASLPQGTFNDWYKSGWNVNVPFGWQSTTNPLGVRFDVGYNRLSGRDFDFGVLGSGSTRDPQIWSGLVDLKLDLPLGTSAWRPKLYALGGGGVHYFRNFTSDFNRSAGTGTGTALQTELDGSSQTKFGLNGGAGFSFGVGQADLFLEARYTSVFTSGKNTNYVPIVAGITFF
jgi:hypothetical protein